MRERRDINYLHNVAFLGIDFGNDTLISAGNFNSCFVALNFTQSVESLNRVTFLRGKENKDKIRKYAKKP